ncbi:phosphonate metabolism transcriptional regulator PhnF [Phyllobacterium zundukense]|uniref:Phosphonate metabolism transcriptional regulator PhnF n=1 Tax=Phyllobacterium zundukense TaxID=1867719 RepID=A0A2N9VYN1_9HYPH|nr:phosphonate metabolism transcriptional regulator PhnF [Phyllobacterium zundukense]PIO44599.1 phosphonate metabolism transcriptional regulator PhnF [Phyllobacterium zundukense]
MSSRPSGTSEQPRWKTIVETLHREILEGEFDEEGRLPADTKIAERFGVSRMTSRKALAILQNKGLIRIEHGRGAFIESDVLEYRMASRITFPQNVRANNQLPSRKLISAESRSADGWVCSCLDLAPGTTVLAVQLIAEGNGRPVAFSTNFLDLPRFSGFVEAMGQEADVESALAKFGFASLWPGTAKVIARMPTEEESKLLDQSLSRPVVEKKAVEMDEKGRPVWCHVTCYAADRIQFVFDGAEPGK